MAIDFPSAGLVVGQLFTASNGVTYRWDGTLWLTQAGPGGGTGDFCVSGSGALATTLTTSLSATIISGNSGGYYNSVTGRWTPPAGRYSLYGWMSGSATSGATTLQLSIRKNGTAVNLTATMTTSAANFAGEVGQTFNVDANGTDWFDMQVASSGTGGSAGTIIFGAFPLTGMQGPMGSPFGGGTGDFCANQTSGFPTLTGSYQTLIPPTILSGNSGGFYSTSTGRWTPPAGRYALTGYLSMSTGGTQSSIALAVRKNGVMIDDANQTSVISGWASLTLPLIVDANGSDWFDIQGASSAGTSNIATILFQAFPLTGMQGPAGPPGQLGFRLLQRTVVSSAVPDVSIQNIPADINDLRFSFDLTPVTTGSVAVLQFYDGAGALIATNYVGAVTLSAHTQAVNAAPLVMSSAGAAQSTAIMLHYTATGNNISSVLGIRGSGSIYNIRAAGRTKSVDFQSSYLNEGGTAWNICVGSGVWGIATPAAITGFRIFFNLNIASGAFSVWGSA